MKNQSSCINWPQFYVSDDVPCAPRPFMTGCGNLQLRRVVNTFDTMLFSHVIIGIDHGRSGVTATTPEWFVVRRRQVPAGQQITTDRDQSRKLMAHLAIRSGSPMDHDKPLVAPAFVILAYCVNDLVCSCSTAIMYTISVLFFVVRQTPL